MLGFSITLLLLANPKSPNVFEVLQEYNFQVNMLPTGITSYTLNKDTGEFQVNIGDACRLSVKGFDLMFESTISGVIVKTS